MIQVQPKDNTPEAFEQAMRIFKKKTQNDGFIQEIRERRYFTKPSDKKRAEKREWERNNLKPKKRKK